MEVPPLRELMVVIDITIVGDYNVKEPLGQGNYAGVVLAEHDVTEEKVAIKIFDITELDKPAIDRIQQEADIMRMLDHPNIIKFIQLIETDTNIYLIMEYASNGDLTDYMEIKGRLKEPEARAMFRQMVSAIEYCHQNRVIHRDIKLDNIFLDSEMNIKIGDFGLGHVLPPGYYLDTFCGSVPYFAPEIFLENDYGLEADVWSLGVTLYALLTDDFPFVDSPMEDFKEQAVRCTYNIPSYMSAACEALLRKMLVVDVEHRANLRSLMNDRWLNKGYVRKLRPYRRE